MGHPMSSSKPLSEWCLGRQVRKSSGPDRKKNKKKQKTKKKQKKGKQNKMERNGRSEQDFLNLPGKFVFRSHSAGKQ